MAGGLAVEGRRKLGITKTRLAKKSHFPCELGCGCSTARLAREKDCSAWRSRRYASGSRDKGWGVSLTLLRSSSRCMVKSSSQNQQPIVIETSELPYATSSDGNSDGKISFPVFISFIDMVSAGNTTKDSKQALHVGQCHT